MANNYSKYSIVRVTPTMDAGTAYANGDVLFNSTEIPDAVIGNGGCSKLVAVFLNNHKDSSFNFDIVFTEKQVNLGTRNDVVGSGSLWTESLAKAAGVIGFLETEAGDNDINLINSQLVRLQSDNDHTVGDMPMLLQAASDSTSVYFSAIDRTGSIDFGADDLEFIFHIERK
tara:strand:- start:1162 stop:1677 length:516 start_codon:yes stop_codon:yes gene_type:complete